MSIRKGNSIIAGNPTLDSVVTTNTAQTITGNKTFSGTVQVPTSSADVGTSTEAVNVKYLYDEGYSTLRSNTANIDLSNLSNTGESHFQAPLVSGSNIKTINGNSVLGSGDLTISGGSDIDNSTITLNTDDEIQTVGVIDNRSGSALKLWTGTRSQYDAIQNKDVNTLYNITDDTDVTLSILEILYPVGSLYITTANSCPLSLLISGSTWELVSNGRVLQGADNDHAVGTTIEAGLPDISFTVKPGGKDIAMGYGAKTTVSGCARLTNGTTGYQLDNSSSQATIYALSVDASRSSSIYGNSTTVQPPAYVVNVFRRVS